MNKQSQNWPGVQYPLKMVDDDVFFNHFFPLEHDYLHCGYVDEYFVEANTHWLCSLIVGWPCISFFSGSALLASKLLVEQWELGVAIFGRLSVIVTLNQKLKVSFVFDLK